MSYFIQARTDSISPAVQPPIQDISRRVTPVRGPISDDDRLHVAVAYSNPLSWATRRALMENFRSHMEASPNVALHVVELAYQDRPFEVTSSANPLDLQLRTKDELWHKENILNLAIRRFPQGWKWGAVIDADLHFTREDWALETIRQLQHHRWVQLFSSLSYLSPAHRPHRLMSSFAYNWLHNRKVCTSGNDSPGAVWGAWGFTREGFDAVGGLIECCILGSGDWHMVFGMVGGASGRVELEKTPASYSEAIRSWQRRSAAIKADIGCVDNHAAHHWHGTLQSRGYGERVNVLVDHGFDPAADVCHDWQGVLRFTGNKPGLRDAIRAYFRSRNEDSIHMAERHLV
jgi:hypothetical protein